MNPLRQALADYLMVRRALGYKLDRAGRLLAQLVTYLEGMGEEAVTTDHVLAWAMLPGGENTSWWAYRLSAARGFASYLHALNPASEVPPPDLLPHRSHRATPYLYSGKDVIALLAAARSLRSPLRVATYQTLIGLLAVTGLRVGEAIRLDRTDLDFDHGGLTVHNSKFGKSREVPLHPTTLDALHRYLHRRDQLRPNPTTPTLFISTAGTRLLYCNVNWTFLKLVRHAHLQPRSPHCRPRLHDLRHTFAVQTLLDCYREDDDPARRLPVLSTHLGHVDPAATYWYLSAAPELLGLASERLERYLGGRP